MYTKHLHYQDETTTMYASMYTAFFLYLFVSYEHYFSLSLSACALTFVICTAVLALGKERTSMYFIALLFLYSVIDIEREYGYFYQ